MTTQSKSRNVSIGIVMLMVVLFQLLGCEDKTSTPPKKTVPGTVHGFVPLDAVKGMSINFIIHDYEQSLLPDGVDSFWLHNSMSRLIFSAMPRSSEKKKFKIAHALSVEDQSRYFLYIVNDELIERLRFNQVVFTLQTNSGQAKMDVLFKELRPCPSYIQKERKSWGDEPCKNYGLVWVACRLPAHKGKYRITLSDKAYKKKTYDHYEENVSWDKNISTYESFWSQYDENAYSIDRYINRLKRSITCAGMSHGVSDSIQSIVALYNITNDKTLDMKFRQDARQFLTNYDTTGMWTYGIAELETETESKVTVNDGMNNNRLNEQEIDK